MKRVERYFRAVLAVCLAAPSGIMAQTFPALLHAPPAYTTAALPTTGVENGQLALVTDGDAAGTYVVYNASDANWYALTEVTLGIINPATPPYNCRKDAPDNSPCMQAVADRAELNVRSGTTTRVVVYFPHRYTVTAGIVFDFGAETSAIVELRSAARSGGLECNYRGTTPCVQFTGSGSSLNTFVLQNVQFTGGPARPDILVHWVRGAQIFVINSYVGGFNRWGLDFTGSTVVNVVLADSICEMIGPVPKGRNPACIAIGPVSRLLVSRWNIEVSTSSSSDLHFVHLASANSKLIEIVNNLCAGNNRLGGFVRMNTSATNVFKVNGNECTGLVDYAVDTGGFSRVSTYGEVNDNIFTRSSPGPGRAINLEDCTGCSASRNKLVNFHEGIRGENIMAAEINDNFIAEAAYGIIPSGSYSYTTIARNKLRNIAANAILARRGSGGFNKIYDNEIEGAAPPEPYDLTGLGALSDSFAFGRGAQTVTCADTGAAGPRIVTDTPYQGIANIDNNDRAGGCEWILGDGPKEGARVRVYLGASKSAQPVRVSGDGGTNCSTLAAGSVSEWEWRNSDWQLVTGPSLTGC